MTSGFVEVQAPSNHRLKNFLERGKFKGKLGNKEEMVISNKIRDILSLINYRNIFLSNFYML